MFRVAGARKLLVRPDRPYAGAGKARYGGANTRREPWPNR